MDIYFLRMFWFGDRAYSDTADHPDYLTIRFAHRPNIDAQVWLNILSPGATYSGGAVTAIGLGAAGFKSYAALDEHGEIVAHEIEGWVGSVRIERVVDLTVAFHVRLAWSKADGMIHYWSNGAGAAERRFVSPAQVETTWRIEDATTDRLLATETVWTDEGADPYSLEASPRLLAEIEERHRETGAKIRVVRVEPGDEPASGLSTDDAGSVDAHDDQLVPPTRLDEA